MRADAYLGPADLAWPLIFFSISAVVSTSSQSSLLAAFRVDLSVLGVVSSSIGTKTMAAGTSAAVLAVAADVADDPEPPAAAVLAAAADDPELAAAADDPEPAAA